MPARSGIRAGLARLWRWLDDLDARQRDLENRLARVEAQLEPPPDRVSAARAAERAR